MVCRYHYVPHREICVGVLAVCRVDLVRHVGGAGWSRYPKSRKRWPVWPSLDRSKGLRGDAFRWWWRSNWRKIRPDQDGVELRRCGVSCGLIARRLEWHRFSPEGRGGGECRPPPFRLTGFRLGSLCPRRSVDGICPRGVDGGDGIHFRRELFYGEPEVGRKVPVLEHEFRNAKFQVGVVVGVGRRLARRLPVGTRDHDRPGYGGRGFSGGRRRHGWPS